MSYERWQRRLAGEKVPTFLQPDADDIGFYRKPITEPKLGPNGKTNGQKKIIGWEPVAYYLDGEKLCGRIKDRDLTTNEVADESLWSWVVSHPISEELYRAVAERGEPWPDLKQVGVDLVPVDGFEIPAANREVSKTDNRTVLEDPPELQHATAIDNAIAAALKTVTNEAEAGQALGSKNRIAELRLAADKAGKLLYDPPFREYKRLHGLWSPMFARADTAEKALNKAILTFREKERQRIAAEQAEADKKQREIDDANQRAADRAIIASVPEELPEIVEVEQPVPVAPILPTYGTRKLKEEVKIILDAVTDYDAVYAFLKAEPELKALLLKLATAKVKAGFTVPGTTTREGLI